MSMALPPAEDTRSEVRGGTGGHLRATSAADASIMWSRSSTLGKPWWPCLQYGCPRRSTEPNADARQTKRTVWCGRHGCAKPYGSLYMLIDPCVLIMSGVLGRQARATRYAQCGLGGTCAQHHIFHCIVLRPWAALAAPRGSTEPNADAHQPLRTVWIGRHVCAKPQTTVYSLP